MKNAQTPILDLLKEPPAPGPTRKYRFVIAGAVGGVIGLALAVASPGFGWAPGFSPVLFLVFWYVAVAVHEAAHLVVGKAVGFRIDGIEVGGAMLARSGNRWLFRFDRSRMLGGLVKTAPNQGRSRAADHALMVAAGPVASVLLACAMALALARWGDGGFQWIGSMFWAAAVLAAISLSPSWRRLNRSDVSRVWQLLSDPDGTRGWMAALAVQAAETSGARPREWSEDSMNSMLVAKASGPEKAHRNLLGFYWRWDRGETTEALDCLETALAHSRKLDKRLRIAVFLEASFASAVVRGDSEQARVWLDRARKLGKLADSCAVDAAIAMSDTRFADAIRGFAEAMAFVEKQKLDSGLARFANVKYAELMDDCRAALAGTANCSLSPSIESPIF